MLRLTHFEKDAHSFITQDPQIIRKDRQLKMVPSLQIILNLLIHLSRKKI